MTDTDPSQPFTVPELLHVLKTLGAPAEVPPAVRESEAVLHLSHGLVGAAERTAMEAEFAAREDGNESPGIVHAIEEAYSAANAQSRLDVMAHLQWRATRLVQALQALINDYGHEDPVLHTALTAIAGASGLLSAHATVASGGDKNEALAVLRKGAQALDVAAERAQHLP